MSLYRQAGRMSARTVALASAGALVIGLLAGFAIGRATEGDPSLADELGELRTDLRPAREGVEQTAVEYGSAVRAGRVVAPTEYDAAKASVARAREAIASARDDLRALDPARAAAVERSVKALEDAVGAKAPPAQVERRSRAAQAAIAAASGG
ncbi:MAG TPA: hypothetical protein VJT75_13110 [Thermoleophilaceae bacterium]|nr:hypothetical protein [Thermoleophilaceae bacterium]